MIKTVPPVSSLSRFAVGLGLLASPVLALLAGLAFPIPSAEAQSIDYGALEELFEEPVTTSVTGSPQRASSVPATMEIISADEIRRSGASDIPGVLRHVNGLDVLRWTNSGPDVGVRGYNKAFSSRILVLINGRQVYADHYGYTPWSTLPVELGEIRQIEIVKGPNSALFGFNAVGGVINIITYSPLYDDVDFAMFRAGTQDLVEGAAVTTFPIGESGAARVSAGGRKNEDFSTPLAPASMGSRRGDERASVTLDAHFRLRPHLELEIGTGYTHADQTNLGPTYAMAFEEMTTRFVQARLLADTPFGLLRADVYRNWFDNMFDVYAPSQPDVPLFRFRTQVSVAQVENVFKIRSDHTVRLSGEYRHSRMDTSPVAGGRVFYDILSAGAMWSWQITPAVALTNAWRHDSLNLGRTGVFPDGLGQANEDWDRMLHRFSFNSGLVWELSPNDTLQVIAGRGTQLPNLSDLGGTLISVPVPPQFQPPSVGYVVGLPSLAPTTVTNYELAWDRQLPLPDTRLRLATFVGTTRDVVSSFGASIPEANIFSTASNIGDSRTQGVEGALQGVYRDDWRWGVGYIYQEVHDDFSPLATLTNFEHTTPRHNATADLGWSQGPWEVDGYIRYQSRFDGLRAGENAFAPERVPIAGYAAVDARVAYQLLDRLTLSLSGQNLLTGEQMQTAGPMVERRVLATITIRSRE